MMPSNYFMGNNKDENSADSDFAYRIVTGFNEKLLCLYHGKFVRYALYRVTDDLERRVFEHKHKLVPGFSSKYNVNRLVYYEETRDIKEALNREKQIKGWLRVKKVELITSCNPKWQDLNAEWDEPR